MKKLTKKTLVILSSMLLCVTMVAMPVLAASESQDGLEVNLVTNKEVYTQKEEIIATLSVKNTNRFTITNLSLENIIPKEYKLAEDSVATKQIEFLAAGETVTLKVIYVAELSNKPNVEDKDEEKRPENVSNNEEQPSTGDKRNVILYSGIMILAALCIIGVLIKNKKHGKKAFSLFLCLTTAGVTSIVMATGVKAAKSQNKFISISESITVSDSDFNINAIVKYDEASEESSGNTKPIRPENSPEEEYYWDNSEVIDVIDVKQSGEVLTEAEVITLLRGRGFDGYPITYEYSMNGDYNEETEALKASIDKHPMYQTYYESKNGELFTISVINGSIIVNPASFNLESELEVELLISESETLTSYVDEVNKFYVTIPKDTVAIIKTVEIINAETLDKIIIEGKKKL